MKRTVRTGVVLALAIAGVVGVAGTSCGPEQPVACGEGTCSGCCTAEGNCVAVTSQRYAVCGSAGATCRSCLPGQDCEQGRCAEVTDAGVGNDACNAENCAGCCAGDSCVAYAGQSALACGALGATCTACQQGYACATGTCVRSVDAGSGCGRRGESCCSGGGCFTGLICSAGTCSIPGAQDAGTSDGGVSDGGTGTRVVGEACTSGGQCATGDCRVLGFPSGYCTRSCASAAECPAGSTCGEDPNDPGGGKLCLAACPAAGVTSGCRSGYVCERRTTLNGSAVCIPGCNSPALCGSATTCDPRGFCCGADGFACCNGTTCDTNLSCDGTGYCKPPVAGVDAGTADAGTRDAGTGGGGVGAACTSNTACTSGICAAEASGGSGSCPTGPCNPGGYCIADCTNTPCPSGASCSPWAAANPVCMKNCATAGGQSSCRSGYVCDKNWVPNSAQAICIDACNSRADCLSPTDTLDCVQGFCCGKTGYRCCGGAGGTCQYGGSCGTDGYCQ